MTSRIIIAVDGYSSTGKSTFAKAIAKELGYVYIDTGAMYRAVTLLAIRKGCAGRGRAVDAAALEALLSARPSVDVSFRVSGPDGTSETWLDGENVESSIRTLEVSGVVSHIAALPFVRDFVDRRLREIGARKGVVMDGRDIGTAVFPDAELKIFMTARPEVRARRRLEELRSRGEITDYAEVLRNIEERDYMDRHRKTAPLVKAADAVELDNSDMTVEDQMEWFRNLIKERKL
ncbi:MAG TPA: (d)CMP kinase [Candidatus Coprenecus stercoravium]|uniref:Cytidylate kinase n=1 Tax=Candidatus Coprenecus stercoravium TaxID=2840735 RepID=A0A9D2GQ18_9BACT|nr:(d)CMP kinase [Candidatus Coprenecus stercoravium]